MNWWSAILDLGIIPILVGGVTAALLTPFLAPAFESRRRRLEREEARRLRLADVCEAVADAYVTSDEQEQLKQSLDTVDGNEYFRVGSVLGLQEAAQTGYGRDITRDESAAHDLLRPVWEAVQMGQPEDTGERDRIDALRDVSYLLRPPRQRAKKRAVRKHLGSRIERLALAREQLSEAIADPRAITQVAPDGGSLTGSADLPPERADTKSPTPDDCKD